MTDSGAALIAAVLSALGGLLVPAQRVEVAVPVGPPPPAITAPAGLHCPDFYFTAVRAGWVEGELAQVDRIMWRESNCAATSTHRNGNGSVDRGLMQINSVNLEFLADYGITADDLLTPEPNLKAARLLYERVGWRPWTPLP